MSQIELLIAAMQERNISARRLGALYADMAGIKPEDGRRSVQRWLAGAGISDESAGRLAAVFGKPVDYFKKPPRERTPPWREEVADLRATLAELERRLRSLEEPRRSQRANPGARE